MMPLALWPKVLLPVGLGTALSLMGDSTLYTVLPTHTQEAGVVLGAVGILLGVNRAVRLLFNPVAGYAYDRFDKRALFLSSLLVGALSTAVCAAARGFTPLLAGRILWGLAWSGIWIGGSSIILDSTQEERRGRELGFYQTWFLVGVALGSVSSGLLTDLAGYRPALWLGAGVSLLGFLASLILLPATRQASPPGRLRPDLPSLRRPPLPPPILWGPALLISALIQGLNRFILAGLLSAALSLLVANRFGAAGLLIGVSTLTGLLTAGRMLLGSLLAPLAGALSDAWRDRWRVVQLCQAVGLAAMLLIAWRLPAALLLGVALSAFSYGSIPVLLTAVSADCLGPQRRSQAVGLLQSAGDIGSALGPPFAFFCLPGLGLGGLFLLAAGLYALGLGAVLSFRPILDRS